MEMSYTNSIVTSLRVTSHTSSRHIGGEDFDVYFKRAAELQLQQAPSHHQSSSPVHHHHHQQQQQQYQSPARRDSAPDRRSSSTERRRTGSVRASVRHKRTSSCRYPQNRPTISVTHDVTPVRREQSSSPNEQTPLTAGCHRARLGQLLAIYWPLLLLAASYAACMYHAA